MIVNPDNSPGRSLGRNTDNANYYRKIILKIAGMGCNECKKTVENALKDVQGVTDTQVDLLKQEAIITGVFDCVQFIKLIKCVKNAGYSVVGYIL